MITSNFNTSDDVITYLSSQEGSCFFRGQTPENRLLNCTLARELRRETKYLPQNYIPIEPLSEWTVSNLCGYHIDFCYKWFNYEGVFSPHGGDPVFELIRHVQQEPEKPKIKGSIVAKHPTPALEFSKSSLTALYFASKKDKLDGGVFLISRQNLEIHQSFENALLEMTHTGKATPCLIDPLLQINDVEQLKIKRQKPVYIFQRDLRFSIDHYLPIQKVIIKKEWHDEVRSFLIRSGISEDFICGRELGIESQ